MKSATDAQARLVKELRGQVVALEPDLRARAAEEECADRLTGEYERARAAERTGVGFTEWRDARVTQAAAAWVLATVFLRYCEDNDLIDRPFLAGPGERLLLAEEHHGQFRTTHPTLNSRNWLLAAIAHLSDAHPTAAGLFDAAHNPLWDITPSYEAAEALIAFWRRRGDDGAIRHDLTGWDTRFLGDVYQDLSEAAARPTRCCRPPSSWRSSSSTSPWTPRSRSSGCGACAPSTRPAAPGTSCSACSAGCCAGGVRWSRVPAIGS